MGKKFMNTVLFLLVAVAAATLTAYVGKGSGNVLFYDGSHGDYLCCRTFCWAVQNG